MSFSPPPSTAAPKVSGGFSEHAFRTASFCKKNGNKELSILKLKKQNLCSLKILALHKQLVRISNIQHPERTEIIGVKSEFKCKFHKNKVKQVAVSEMDIILLRDEPAILTHENLNMQPNLHVNH